jgi:hypothetical protein
MECFFTSKSTSSYFLYPKILLQTACFLDFIFIPLTVYYLSALKSNKYIFLLTACAELLVSAEQF